MFRGEGEKWPAIKNIRMMLQFPLLINKINKSHGLLLLLLPRHRKERRRLSFEPLSTFVVRQHQRKRKVKRWFMVLKKS